MGVSVCLCACNAHVAGTYICLRHCYTHKNTYHGSDFALVYAKKFYLQLRKVSLSSKEKHNSVFLSIRVPSEMTPPKLLETFHVNVTASVGLRSGDLEVN